jgi:hypothetical protein
MDMNKKYQTRNKFFFAVPALFPKWDYPSRLAIGVKLSDAEYRNAPTFRFKIKNIMYEIDRDKAIILGNRYKLYGGKLPNLLPKEEFNIIK